MLLYDFVPLAIPYETAVAWMSSLAPGALASAAATAFGLPSTDGALEQGDARHRGEAMLVELRWTGRPTASWCSRLEGDLAVAPLAAGCHLSLSVSYEPSAGLPPAPSAGRARLHREAEARARRFLGALARSLG